MELLVEIIGWALYGGLQAVAAILWPSEDPQVRRLQRVCLAILLAGVATGLGGAATLYLAPSRNTIALFVATLLLLLASGALGHRIEQLCKGAQQRRPQN